MADIEVSIAGACIWIYHPLLTESEITSISSGTIPSSVAGALIPLDSAEESEITLSRELDFQEIATLRRGIIDNKIKKNSYKLKVNIAGVRDTGTDKIGNTIKLIQTLMAYEASGTSLKGVNMAGVSQRDNAIALFVQKMTDTNRLADSPDFTSDLAVFPLCVNDSGFDEIYSGENKGLEVEYKCLFDSSGNAYYRRNDWTVV